MLRPVHLGFIALAAALWVAADSASELHTTSTISGS
jgi:hypothetical protein